MAHNSRKRTVSLDNVRQNNIVVVDLNEKLSETIFEQEYRQAAQIIRNILSHTSQLSSHGNPRESSLSPNRTEHQTTVPFIGDRGTGKTSMMYSILRRLEHYEGDNASSPFCLGDENSKVKFIALDMIDTSTLRHTEDILEIILSRILSYLENYKGTNDFRELYRKIDSLCKDLSHVYWKKSFELEEAGLMSLKRIADSQKSIESFQDLVSSFLNCIAEKEQCKTLYLVLALDDIDMYQGSDPQTQSDKFSLLEKIYDYMRIPGLIVLLTYNESILKRNCISHFRRTYFGHDAQKDCSLAAQEEIELLTRQYMEKLFPQEQRVYLPNFMRIDSANRPNLHIIPTLNGKMIPPFKAGEEPSVKEFMLRLIAYKTGVYFDAGGTKKHFFEARNLRELGSMFMMVNSMDNIPTKAAAQEEIRTINRQKLLNYLYNQFGGERLSTEEYRRFQTLSMLPLIRQDRTLVDDVRQQRMRVAPAEDDFGYLPKTKRDRWKYSYGELLHNIYYATRIPYSTETEGSYLSKAYIQCILGTHSVIMNQAVHSPRPQEEWMRIWGSSIAGRWANDMLPDFLEGPQQSDYSSASKKSAVGSASLPIGNFLHWPIPPEVQKALVNLSKVGDTKEDSSKTKAIKDYLQALTLIGMLFTGFPKNGLKIQLEASMIEDTPMLSLISTSVDHICFNALNFVINQSVAIHPCSIGGEDCSYLGYINTKLRQLGNNLCEEFSKDHNTVKNEAISARKEYLTRAEALQKAAGDPHQIDRLRHKASEQETESKIAEAWIKLLGEGKFDKSQFIGNWNTLLGEIFGDGQSTGAYPEAVKKWETNYQAFHFSLPVQHFDMMYNIIKRLANVSYHDIPEEASIDEVYDYFVRLYENISQELKKQDATYFANGTKGFAEAYSSSLFYRTFTATKDNPDYNPYVKELFISMLKSWPHAVLERDSGAAKLSLFGESR